MTRDSSRPGELNRLSRRTFLGTSAASMLALGGCVGGSDDGSEETPTATPTATSPETIDEDNVPELPRVENPPAAVYVPSHKNAMQMLSSVEAGDFSVSPMITYPHKFWLVTGDQREVVNPDSFGVHLMVTVWDAETGTVLPVDKGAQVTVTKNGEYVTRKAPWPMISQRMGFHFGENVALPDNGTYTVELQLNPLTGVRKTGAFEGRFESAETVSFEFEYSQETQRTLADGIEYLPEDRWGERDALGPMMMGGMGDGEGGEMDGMGMKYSQLPTADGYPGKSLGPQSSGDASFVVRYLEETELSDGTSGYLLVSPRTPYNRVPLPDTALSITGAIEGELRQALDSDVGYHYGLSGDLSPGAELEINVDSPPQVARQDRKSVV